MKKLVLFLLVCISMVFDGLGLKFWLKIVQDIKFAPWKISANINVGFFSLNSWFWEHVGKNIVHSEDRCSYPKEKIKFFFKVDQPKKKRGVSEWLCAQKKQNLGVTEIFGWWGGRRVQKEAGWKFCHIVHPTLRNFNFNQNPKSYANSNLCNHDAEKSKIMVAPPR